MMSGCLAAKFVFIMNGPTEKKFDIWRPLFVAENVSRLYYIVIAMAAVAVRFTGVGRELLFLLSLQSLFTN